MTRKEAERRIVTTAPEGWEGMYAADITDARLDEVGAVYGYQLPSALRPLHALGFTCVNGEIGGTRDGRRVFVTVWYHGQTVPGVVVAQAWRNLGTHAD